MRFLKLRLVVNGMHLHLLLKNKPVVINIPTNPSRIVVTDGFHITKPFKLTFVNTRTHYFTICCAIEDDQLVVALIIMILLYSMGATSGIIFLQILSLAPILYILFLYYIRRKDFIQIREE